MTEATGPSSELSEALIKYFATREQERNERVERLWATMTKRERHLVREVAIMAHVRALPFGERPLPVTTLLVDVLSACLGMPDLYPTIDRLDRLAARKQKKEPV